MRTKYRSTGSARGDYNFDNSLKALIGQATRASQFNYLVENTNYLFMSCMHGRRGHTPECAQRNMYECESGRIWVIGKFTGSSIGRQIKTIFDPKPSVENVTIPWDLTGRILTIHGRFALFRYDTDDNLVDSWLPGGQNDEYLWKNAEYRDYFTGMLYTGPGIEVDEDEITYDSDYVFAQYLGGGVGYWRYLYIYVKRSNNPDERVLRAQLHTHADTYTKCAFVLDITYSPRIPYYGEIE